MAKVATSHAPISADLLQYGGGAKLKRKTPNQLRGEQLKRKNVIELVDESPAPFPDTMDSSKANFGIKKPESFKSTRYIDTRLDEVYPITKSRLRIPSGKENAKKHISGGKICSLDSFPSSSTTQGSNEPQASSSKKPVTKEVAKDVPAQKCQSTKTCIEKSFRGVHETLMGSESLSCQNPIDMGKALLGLAAVKPSANASHCGKSAERFDKSRNFSPELHISGQKTPLDLTLRTNMRLVSSTTVSWFHRLILGSDFNSITQFHSQSNRLDGQNHTQASNFESLCSWMYPQSSLPASVISMLTLSAAAEEMEFLRKRYQAWGDSFRSLYYMLRKNACNIFYVCTPHFVVMFTRNDGAEKGRSSCNAYISRSTVGLRSLLKEHDIGFSMPLCNSKLEEEDLGDLSEIEKHNVGQTRRLVPTYNVDGTVQSLLAFIGNENAHGLYDFLLNYRSFLTSLSIMDVPVLCSPIAFQNASVFYPEITCKEMKRTEHVTCPPKGTSKEDGESDQGSSPGICYSIEIKDKYIPPWIICSLCSIMGSEGRSFEASFTTEPTSIGLNIALENFCQISHSQGRPESLKELSGTFGIPDAVATPQISRALLKELKYCNNSYAASLSAV